MQEVRVAEFAGGRGASAHSVRPDSLQECRFLDSLRSLGMTASTQGRRMIQNLGQIALTVRDMERSIEFYRDDLGLRFLFAPAPTLAFLMIGDVRLMLSAPEGGFAPGGSTVLYLRVADIDAEHATLVARGVAFIDTPHLIARMPDHELWMCFFRDPDGHTLALMNERPLAA